MTLSMTALNMFCSALVLVSTIGLLASAIVSARRERATAAATNQVVSSGAVGRTVGRVKAIWRGRITVIAAGRRTGPGWRALSQGHGDASLQTVYWVSYGVVLALLPLGGVVDRVEVVAALGLQLALGLVVGLGPRLKPGRSRPAAIAGVATYLCSVALLRDGAIPTAGLGPLVLLPVVWTSLRGTRGDLAVAVSGVAAVYLLPELLIGPPHYPAGGWRAGVLFVVLATTVGLALRRLAGRVATLVEQLDGLARRDELTGLANRRAWRELFDHELASARRSGQPLTVAMLDLDRFKDYNDTHGHLAGDRLLVEAAGAWRGALRATDVLARWGGDEFGLLLPGCDIERARTLVGRMRSSCLTVGFSVGLAEWDAQSSSEELLSCADRDLYAAKRDASRGTPRAGATRVEPGLRVGARARADRVVDA